MKTKPIVELLPLPLNQSATVLMNLFHDAIHELVCYGTHILYWTLKENRKKQIIQNELAIAAPLLLRHILELTDSISVQMKSGVIVPCKLQLRAILEASLSLEYMLEIENKRELRASCFFIADHYRKRNNYEKKVPGTVANDKYKASLKNIDLYLNGIYDRIDHSEAFENMRSLIEQPQYTEARSEYLRFTKDNKKYRDGIKWYALFGGPESLFDLAEHLRKRSLYDELYKPYSDPIHGTNLSQGVLDRAEDGLGTFNQLRVLLESRELAELTIVLGVTIYEIIIEKTLPKEKKGYWRWVHQFDRYYLSEIKKIKVRTVPDTSEL